MKVPYLYPQRRYSMVNQIHSSLIEFTLAQINRLLEMKLEIEAKREEQRTYEDNLFLLHVDNTIEQYQKELKAA